MSRSPSNKSHIPGPPERFNPKIQAKKMQGQDFWAEVLRQQLIVASHIEEQEKMERNEKKHELSEALAESINIKAVKKRIEVEAKQRENMRQAERKEQYANFIENVKNGKLEKQRELREAYEEEQRRKQQEHRRKIEEEREIERRMAFQAMDSLEKEKLERDRKKMEFIHSLHPLEAQKKEIVKHEYERQKREKEDMNQYWEQERYENDRKNWNYKMFYQKINERQQDLMDLHTKGVLQDQKSPKSDIDYLINKGISDLQRRAEDEDRKLRLKRQEQMREMQEGMNDELNENMFKGRLSPKNQPESLSIEGPAFENHNDRLKRNRMDQMQDYKNSLDLQVSISENVKRKAESDLLERDRKIHLASFSLMPPGINRSRFENNNAASKKTLSLQLSKSQDYGNPFSENSYASIENENFRESVSPSIYHYGPASFIAKANQNLNNDFNANVPRQNMSYASPLSPSYHYSRAPQDRNLNILASIANRNLF